MNDFAVQLTGVGKDYRFFSLRNIDLEIPHGHIMGFIGPSGAGKSTTIRILMGLVHQDRGQVRVLGHPMPAEQAAAKWDIGFASEDMRLYEAATLDWHIRFIRSIYPTWDHAYSQTLLKRFDLRPEQKIKGLSHGQRVKASLLLVLARRPRLLVLDEPTTGLDPVARHEVLRELTDVMGDDRRSILFSSHNTQDVEQISDRITFIDRGRIIDSLDKETFLDRWRRIRVELPSGIEIPVLPGVIDVKQMGRLGVATTNAYVEGLPRTSEAAGIHVLVAVTRPDAARRSRPRRRQSAGSFLLADSTATFEPTTPKTAGSPGTPTRFASTTRSTALKPKVDRSTGRAPSSSTEWCL